MLWSFVIVLALIAVIVIARAKNGTVFALWTVATLVGATLLWLAVHVLFRPYQYYKVQRERIAASATGDIRIAVVWPEFNAPGFVNGIALAVDEINANGGVSVSLDRGGHSLRRRLRIKRFYEGERNQRDPVVARIARDPSLMAVMGHSSSDSAIPASIAYEYAGIPFVVPLATSPELTGYSFQYLLRTIPSDQKIARRLVDFAVTRGMKRMIIIHDRGSYGRGLAEVVEELAEQSDISIILKRSYEPMLCDFRPMLLELRDLTFDGIVMAGLMPEVVDLTRQIRQMNFTQPIFSGDGADDPEYVRRCSSAGQNVFVVSVYHPDLLTLSPATEQFKLAYVKRFGTVPDDFAFQGYEGVKILAQGYHRGNSAVPLVLMTTFKCVKDWDGLLGKYSFTSDGDIVGKGLCIKEVKQGRFELVSGVEGDVP